MAGSIVQHVAHVVEDKNIFLDSILSIWLRSESGGIG
jgi:hypothetical protein